MPKLPRVTATELLRALRRAGWHADHQTGSHIVLLHPTRSGRVTVPFHRGTVRTGTIEGIPDQAGLSPDELRRLL